LHNLPTIEALSGSATGPYRDGSGDIQNSGITGVTDHGALTGLGDDDHAQYLKERVSGGAGTEVPVHTHQSTQGGLLDWDTCWTDAVHNHTSNAEGGTLPFAMELIATITLGGSGVVDFSSIPQTYKHLIVMGMIKTTFTGGANESIGLRFNNNSSNSYWDHYLFGSGSGTGLSTTGGATATSLLRFVQVDSPAAASYLGGGFFFVVPHYRNTTFLKYVVSMPSVIHNNGTPWWIGISGYWFSTSAINRITLLSPNSINLAATTVASLYGVKG
jgi:hypothetical protein